jgi:hypothetical protein
MNGVWNECLEVKRFALPVGRVHLIQVTGCVNLVSVRETLYPNATKLAKHIGAQNVE